MKDTNHHQTSTPDADFCGESRTMSGPDDWRCRICGAPHIGTHDLPLGELCEGCSDQPAPVYPDQPAPAPDVLDSIRRAELDQMVKQTDREMTAPIIPQPKPAGLGRNCDLTPFQPAPAPSAKRPRGESDGPGCPVSAMRPAERATPRTDGFLPLCEKCREIGSDPFDFGDHNYVKRVNPGELPPLYFCEKHTPDQWPKPFFSPRTDEEEARCKKERPLNPVRAEFARTLERELAEAREKNRELTEAWHLLNVLSLNMMDDGPTWPRVLEWLRRNEQYRPANEKSAATGSERNDHE